MSRDVWAIVSDLHCGSTLGLCHPEGVALDDGGRYMPSREQMKLWDCWADYWKAVKDHLKFGDRLILAINGDLVDGDHHRTTQIVTGNLPATQHNIALSVLSVPLSLRPRSIVVVRGTEAHVGGSAAYEERLASELEAVPDVATGVRAHWHFQSVSRGTLLDFAHHGRLGQRPWTKMTGPATLAAQIIMAAAKHGSPVPKYAFRSHYHQWADSGDNYACRVVQMAGWQLSTAFVHRIAAGSLPEVGGMILTCEDGAVSNLTKVKYEWKRSEPWKTETSSALPISPEMKSSQPTWPDWA